MPSLPVRIAIAAVCIVMGAGAGLGYVFVGTQLLRSRVSDEAPAPAKVTPQEQDEAIQNFQKGTSKLFVLCIVLIILVVVASVLFAMMDHKMSGLKPAIRTLENLQKKADDPPG